MDSTVLTKVLLQEARKAIKEESNLILSASYFLPYKVTREELNISLDSVVSTLREEGSTLSYQVDEKSVMFLL